MSIQIVSVSDIVNTYQIPDFQRILDKKRVQEIKETFMSYCERNLYFPWNLLTFCTLQNKDHSLNTFYLIDGQHRWTAIRELMVECPEKAPLKVAIQVLHCSSVDEMIMYFQLIGKSKEIPNYA